MTSVAKDKIVIETTRRTRSHGRRPLWALLLSMILALVWVALFFLTMTNGEIELTNEQIIRVLFIEADEVGNYDAIPHLIRPLVDETQVSTSDRIAHVVIHQARLPRVLLATLAGVAFAVSGVMLQDSMRNVLAEPGIMGISMGAVVVVAFVTVFNIVVPYGLLAVMALSGGLLTGTVLLVAATLKTQPVRLVLIGAAMTALLNALTIILISLTNTNDAQMLYRFLVGSLANRTWDALNLVLPWVLIGVPLALMTTRPLNLLQLGDEMAEGLGLPVVKARVAIFAISIALVSAIVSVAGPIGFVALLAPHITRYLLRSSDARLVMPVAALVGAVLLTGADLIARTLLSPLELPVGIFTVIMGAPLMFVLLRRGLAREGTGL